MIPVAHYTFSRSLALFGAFMVVAATAWSATAARHTASTRSLKAWTAPLKAALAGSGEMPEGFEVTILSAVSGDPSLLTGAKPSVDLGRKSWSGTALTVRVTSGPTGRRKTGWVRFKIQVTAPVAVTVAAVARGQKIRGHHYKVMRREVRPHHRVFGPSSLPLGRTTRRAVSKGQTVVERWLAPMGGVRRGDTMDATWVRGGLTLRFSVQTLEAGRVGQTIEARVVSTQKTVRVAITGPGRLEVR